MNPTQETHAASAALETCVSHPTCQEVALPTGRVPAAFAVAFFPSAFDQRPAARTVSWADVAVRLSSFPQVVPGTRKRDQPCWSPAHYRSSEASRAVDVETVSLLVLDLDGGMAIDEALDRTEGLERLAHTSWSHQPDTPRLRLVLPLARPIPVSDWPIAWTAAVDALDIPADPACKNANRRFLLPMQPPGSGPGHAVLRAAGRALDLAPLVNRPLRRHPRRQRPLCVPPHRRDAVLQALLRREPDSRRRLGDHLGGAVCGDGDAERVERLTCPACGRPSAWFWVAPRRATRARCHHRNTCAWDGPLAELVGAT